MEVFIRECKIDDAAAICGLNANDLGYDFPLDCATENLFLILSKSSDKIFVAELGGQIVGYVHANNYDTAYAPRYKNIMGIAVSGSCRKSGVGKMLLAAVEKWAHDTGAAGVRLSSGESRTGAHEFYRHCGYNSEKKQLNFIKNILNI